VLPTPGFLLAKAPPLAMDSPARESELMVPAPSLILLLLDGSVVTWTVLVRVYCVSRDSRYRIDSAYLGAV